jgi:hypothetical protein
MAVGKECTEQAKSIENVLRKIFVGTIFYNKIHWVWVAIEIGELRKIFGVSHVGPLLLKRERTQKEYIRMF